MNQKKQHGGLRPGAGSKSKGGRKAVTVSVSLSPEKVETVDIMRDDMTRGKYLASLVQTKTKP